MIDFKATFYSAKNIFVEVHCEGKEKEVASVLGNPSTWPFKTTFYSYILHDCDSTENGEKKVSHYHVLLLTDTKQGKSKWLDTLSAMFSFLPREAITVSPVQSERSCNRYLIHIDDPEKFQYDRARVFASNPKRFERALEEVKDTNPSWDTICSWNTEEDIYNCVGMSTYHKAKEVWKDTENARIRENMIDALQVEINSYNRDKLCGLMLILDRVFPLPVRETNKDKARDYESLKYEIECLFGKEK